MSLIDQRVDSLCNAIRYRARDRDLFALSLRHRSWCAENGGVRSNERLEFLGDSVLGLVVADAIFRDYRSLQEGELTDIRKSVVNAVTLAEVAFELDLGSMVFLGKGEEQSGGREKPSILADCLEAVIGAVYLDGGLEAAQRFVLDILTERIQAAFDAGGAGHDHKSRLQERLANVGDRVPKYHFEASGPDHARTFTVRVTAGGDELGSGLGRSKKQAEQVAARAALESLAESGRNPMKEPEQNDA